MKQAWKSNIPTAARILSNWKPPGSVQGVMDCHYIHQLITSQKWKGLQVADIEGKGQGVFTKRPFQIGEVICDYHGREVTARKCHDIRTGEGENGFLFFYNNKKDEPKCIDSSHCDCHPEKETLGRFIHHSTKRANIQPRLYTFESDGEEKELILFLAIKDIQCNEQLFFDYGDKKKSYRGEGLDLHWL